MPNVTSTNPQGIVFGQPQFPLAKTTDEINPDSRLPNEDLPKGFKFDVPYPRNDCLLKSLARFINKSPQEIWHFLCRTFPGEDLAKTDKDDRGLSSFHAHVICLYYKLCIQITYPAGAPARAPRIIGTCQKPDGTISWYPAHGDNPAHWNFASHSALEIYDTKQVSSKFVELWGGSSRLLSLQFDDLPFTPWTPDPKRARTFFKAWCEGEVGNAFNRVMRDLQMHPDTILNLLKSDSIVGTPIDMLFVHGAPGCGKSWPIQQRARQWASNKENLKHLPGSYFAFFRVALLEDWKSKLNLPTSSTYCLKTFELLLGLEIEFLIVDELSQCPPGWLDFVCLFNSNLTRIIALGDVCQSPFSTGSREPTPLDLLPTAIQTVLPNSTPYINFTRRLPQLLAQRLSLCTRSTEVGSITWSHHLHQDKSWQTLVPTMNDASSYTQMMGQEVYTYSSPQGKEWDRVQIVLTNASFFACGAEMLWTAVTRTKRDLHFAFAAPIDANSISGHPILGPILGYNAPLDRYYLFPALRKLQMLHDTKPVHVYGSKLRTVGEALSNWSFQRLEELPPAFRALMPLISEPDQLEPVLNESFPIEPPQRTHLPPASHPQFWPESQPPKGRELREQYWHEVMGAQFDDVKAGREARDHLENIFPHQSAGKDPTLLPNAVKKRLRFSNPEKNQTRFNSMSSLGPAIFASFAKQFNLPESHEFDPELFTKCISDTVERKLDKPITTVWNNIDRSDPDWARNVMSCFVKSQHKAKAETLAFAARWNDSDPIVPLAEDAKAGQTLVTSPDINVFELGPIARYMREVLKKTLPSTVYLHGGKTIAQMNEWSKENATGDEAFTCDFTAYDQSCTEETLSFELAFMSYCGIPIDLIEIYKWIKLNMRTQFGFTAVMRFTGEFGTYDFNTFWNMAYMTLRYRFNPNMACCFSGDDSLFFGRLNEHWSWHRISHNFTLVGKIAYSKIPEFCGWLLYPCGAIRHPILLALKIAYRQARGDLDKCLDNYFLEAQFAYEIGDPLFTYLPPLALEAQRWVMDFCFRHSSLVPHLSRIGDFSRWSHVPIYLLPSRTLKLFLAKFQSSPNI